MIFQKYIALSIHTEALHQDDVWQNVASILRYFSKHSVRATWFSINPTFVGYRAMAYNETKWIERLKIISGSGQEIQQHTHFYKGKEGMPKGEGYDMSRKHMQQRLSEDKDWLEKVVSRPMGGFVSGAWKVNDDLFAVLHEMGYKYDSSFRTGVLRHIHDIVEIPASEHLKSMVLDFFKLKSDRVFLTYKDLKLRALPFHDHDLISFKFRNALKLFIFLHSLRGYRFVSFGDIYKEMSKH